MRVRHISTFLASAAIVLCCSLSPSAAHAAPTPGLYLKGVDVEGNPVKMATKADITAQDQRKIDSLRDEDSYKFSRNGQYLCTFNLNIPSDERLSNRAYVGSSNPEEGILFAKNVINFYLSSHKLSLCLGHDRLPTAKPLVKMMVDPAYAELITPLGMLEHSILESYADLSVVLQGASKTGDWTVFTDGVMRARSGLPDPMHITSNAVSAIIAGIDPKSLKGQTFMQINARVNQEFRKNFLDEKGEISLQSLGVVRIMQEMNFLGKRLKGVATLPGVPSQSAQQLKAQAGLIENFSAKVYSQLPVDNNDYAFLTALQIVDAREQQKLARASTPTSSAGKDLIRQVIQGMDDRQSVNTYLYGVMTHDSRQAAQLLEGKIAVVEKWVRDSRSDLSANSLNEGLAQMISNNTAYVGAQERQTDSRVVMRGTVGDDGRSAPTL